MKAKDLIKILENIPEFEVIVTQVESDTDGWGISYNHFNVTGLIDIGHSNKTVFFEIEERD